MEECECRSGDVSRIVEIEVCVVWGHLLQAVLRAPVTYPVLVLLSSRWILEKVMR